MKFKAEIEIHHVHLKVLLDYHNGIILNEEYFINEELENGMVDQKLIAPYKFGELYYPLHPTPLGNHILGLYLKQRPKNPSAYEKIKEQKELEGKYHTVDLSKYGSEPEPPSLNGIVDDDL